jgi:glutamate-5-semialdehyde dehydrogenase
MSLDSKTADLETRHQASAEVCNETSSENLLRHSKASFYAMATLSNEQKNDALSVLARLIEEEADALLAANQKDLDEAQRSNISAVLYQRLKLDAGKLTQLAQGIRDVMNLPNPVGQILSSTRLDDGLILDKQTVPLGVIGIIFESRPDVLPQILSLILKSGNAVVFKGGSEARHSIVAFMDIIAKLNEACPTLPPHWATMLDTREAIRGILNYPQYVDLVIPRGSNQLVQSVMEATRIPVLGHADGVCHLYVHADAIIESAVAVTIDAKTQYPAACNALETLLVNEAIAPAFFAAFIPAAEKSGIALRGCEKTLNFLPANSTAQAATEADWTTEYGDLTLSVKVVLDLPEAIEHINQYGSHHTDAIVAGDPQDIEIFLNGVDSACVFSNASTRFADGFRFGLGAEIGISTAKTHARGPVGLEGLVIYKYKLRGDGHVVCDYVGNGTKRLQAEKLQ